MFFTELYFSTITTNMFKDAIALGYKPPSTLKEWSERGIGSRFEERDDITWMKKSVYNEYVKIYNGNLVSTNTPTKEKIRRIR